MWWHVEIRILIIKGCEIERCIDLFRSNDETTGQVRQTHVVSFQQYLKNWNWRKIFKFSKLQFLLDLLALLSVCHFCQCKLLIFCWHSYFLAESWVRIKYWLLRRLSTEQLEDQTQFHGLALTFYSYVNGRALLKFSALDWAVLKCKQSIWYLPVLPPKSKIIQNEVIKPGLSSTFQII